MGYTHYWECSDSDIGKIKSHKNYDTCISDMKKVIAANHGIPLEIEDSNFYHVFFNGVDEDSHETFVFPPGRPFTFCKTAEKPYDVVVTACLAVVKHHLGDLFEVSSDGGFSGCAAGAELASEILGQKVENPVLDFGND